MAIYCYTNKAGTTIERTYSAKAGPPKKVSVGGSTYWRDLAVEHRAPANRVADAWRKHWSFSMGARTKAHKKEIAMKCRAAGVEAKFHPKTMDLKVNGRKHQEALANAIFGKNKVVNYQGF